MSRSIVRILFRAFSFIVVLYGAMLIVANKSITRKDVQNKVVINASASMVWEILINFEAYPEWNPFIRKIAGIASEGEKLTAKMRMGNFTMVFRPTVLVVQPERELCWLGHLFIPGIFDGEHSFIIESFGKNQVSLIQREVFNGLIVPLSGILLKNTEHSFKEMNQALKELAEQRS